MQPIHVIAGILAARAQTNLAHSALPNAPVVPDLPLKRRPVRSRTASALHRIADAISPPAGAHRGGPKLAGRQAAC
jgi:hypothetical protein